MLDFRQEIFTKVKNHLLTQNKKCVDNKGNYKLRHEGNKCAASCLIPDYDYSIKMEPCYHWKFFIDSGYSEDETTLIQQLVSIHDDRNPIDWKNQLRKLAVSENLKYD